MLPPRNRKGGDGNPPPKDARASALPDTLSHVVKNKTEAAYARSELFERRSALMNNWASYLAGGAAVRD